jgi:hypothetical protein
MVGRHEWAAVHSRGLTEGAGGRGAARNGGEGRRPAHGEEKGAELEVEESLTCGPHMSAGERGEKREAGR